MSIHVDIQAACTEPVPQDQDICRWVSCTINTVTDTDEAEVSVRLVAESEMGELNHQYRGKSGSTNVLSFPADLPADLQLPLLGDIVVCPAVVIREAQQQHKTTQQHWAHMLVHGSLHLLGYDHIEDDQAEQMEALEISILQSLGCPSPYEQMPEAMADAKVRT